MTTAKGWSGGRRTWAGWAGDPPRRRRRVPPGCATIASIDGEPGTSNNHLQELTLTRKPGDNVSIDHTTDGRSATVTVTLAAQP
jgi:S1-C subfamily serine protease